ncbi:hypothetical protein NXC14_PC00162 (plasmid) [Rhizobium sp. NXC14]|nr:hypothetical protein NXC14_PC00162 [Rhizobium sp. NXC14]
MAADHQIALNSARHPKSFPVNGKPQPGMRFCSVHSFPRKWSFWKFVSPHSY